MKLYEGMFLIDAGRVAKDWDGTESEIVSVLEKHGAAIRQAHRYDERKLAYPVERVRRGAYLLVYFESDPESLVEMREDLHLSEAVLRNLIVRVEGDEVPEPPMLGTAEPTEALEDSDSSDDDDEKDEDENEDGEDEEDD